MKEKNRIKRFLTALLALASAASLTACSLGRAAKPSASGAPEAPAPSLAESSAAETEADAATPEGTARAAIEAIKALDLDKVELYLESDTEDGDYHLFGRDMNERETELAKALVGNLSCTVGETSVSGDSATLPATITNKDLSGVVGKFAAFALKDSLKSAIGGQENADDAKYVAELAHIIEEAGGSSVRQVTLNLSRSGDGWKIKLDGELLDALSGGMTGSLGEFADQLGLLAENFG